MQLKILHIPDVHNYDKEIGQSIGYPQESIRINETILEEFKRGEYHLITFGGDVVHDKLTQSWFQSRVLSQYKELGKLCKERLVSSGMLDKLKVYDSEGLEIEFKDRESIIFTVRGQHDSYSSEDFTFFDLLIDQEVMINPRKVIFDDRLQINFINYTKKLDKIIEKIHNENIESVIGIYHNTILDKGMFVDKILGKTLCPSTSKIFRYTDLAVLNDIHIPIQTYDVVTEGKKTTVMTPGSLGRTSYDKSHDRDYGNIVSIEIDENKDILANLIEIELTPSDKFFDKLEVLKSKIKKNEFQNFSLEIKDVEISYFNVFDEIDKLEEDEEIKSICKEILDAG